MDVEAFREHVETQDLLKCALTLHNVPDLNIPYRGLYEHTLLTYVINNKFTDGLLFLLDMGADPNTPCGNGTPPLIHACNLESSSTSLGLVKILLEYGADVNATDSVYRNALNIASKWGDVKLVMLLVEYGADVNCSDSTPLLNMSVWGQVDAARLLLEHGASINACDESGNSCVYRACHYNRMELVELLLKWGADVNTRNKEGNTPLHVACGKENIDLIHLLVSYGADASIKNNKGRTAPQQSKSYQVHLACK